MHTGYGQEGEQNATAATAQDRKEALRRLTYGVYVVSARSGDDINAMTARMVTQVSMRPACVAVSIARRCYTYQFIQSSQAFAISVLAQGQELLAGHFGLRSGRDVNNFAGVDYWIGATGAPILCECSAFMECRVSVAHNVGNSTIFIGEVINVGAYDATPLVYRHEDYYG